MPRRGFRRAGIPAESRENVNHKLFALLATLAFLPACVAGDPDSVICIDWDNNDFDDCAQVPEPSPEPQPLSSLPCYQLAGEIGSPLEPASGSEGDRYPAWLAPFVSGDTDGDAADLDLAEMYWKASGFLAGWSWSGVAESGKAATLRSITGEDGVDSLAIDEIVSAPGWQWIQTDAATSVTIGPWTPIAIQQEDGSVLHFAHLNEGIYWWELEGVAKVRGWVAGVGVTAGPSPLVPPAEGTWSGLQAFRPASGICCVPTEDGCVFEYEDDGGTGTDPEPMPDLPPEPETPEDPPNSFDPCDMLGEGSSDRPFGFSPAWLDTVATGVVVELQQWIAPAVVGHPWFFSPAPDFSGQPARTMPMSGFAFWMPPSEGWHTAAWVIVEADWLDDFGAETITLMTPGEPIAAEQLPLEDGSWVAYVIDPPEGSDGFAISGFPQVRGWVRNDDMPGVAAATGATVGVTVVGEWAWMPAAGYCTASAPPSDPLDESGD